MQRTAPGDRDVLVEGDGGVADEHLIDDADLSLYGRGVRIDNKY